MIDFVYMVSDTICGIFDNLVGRHQSFSERKALLVFFREEKKSIKMLIHAPANYVGVYTQKGKGDWECISYHDSCWRMDGVERFLFEHKDNHFGFFPCIPCIGSLGFQLFEKVTDAICVITLDDLQYISLEQARKKKYR